MYIISLNFSKPNGIAGYIDTGTWSKKAIIVQNIDICRKNHSKKRGISFQIIAKGLAFLGFDMPHFGPPKCRYPL